MQAFLTRALKDNLNLRLGYVTGIFRTAQASIFSLLNNLRVFTVLDNEFSEYFGFTESEVKKLADIYGASDKIEEISAWYNGYKFGESKIYNPWSILEYFSRSFKPKAYWIGTSDNSLVYELMMDTQFSDQNNLINFMEYGTVTTEVYEAIDYMQLAKSSVAIWTFLLSAGYLTPAGDPDENDIYKLIPPNLEIKKSIIKLFTSKLNDAFGNFANVQKLIEGMIGGQVKIFQDIINEHMITILSNYDSEEKFYHGFILGTLWLKNKLFKLKSQPDSGSGFPDLVIYPRSKAFGTGIIIEFKKAGDLSTEKEMAGKQIQSKIREAFEQIEKKDYETDLKCDPNVIKILKYSIVFAHKRCDILLQIDNETTLTLGSGKSIKLEELKTW
jgi:hypothetical protein